MRRTSLKKYLTKFEDFNSIQVFLNKQRLFLAVFIIHLVCNTVLPHWSGWFPNIHWVHGRNKFRKVYNLGICPNYVYIRKILTGRLIWGNFEYLLNYEQIYGEGDRHGETVLQPCSSAASLTRHIQVSLCLFHLYFIFHVIYLQCMYV